MQKIIIVCGPTAVGKSRVGIELARRFGGEIVSADSQQVWKGFDIGTAKPTSDERAIVPHHLVDVAEPAERFDAARFVALADAAIADIAAQGRVPFIVGGTGMYIRMLLHGICGVPPCNPDIRADIEAEIERRGSPSLHRELEDVDPATAASLSPNDRTRIVRALEIYRLTGMLASEFRKTHGFMEQRYDALKIGLVIDRKELYSHIDARIDRMIALGLVEEVRLLLAQHGEDCQPFQAVGYKEIVAHLRGAMDIDTAVRLMKQHTRNFAKRQMTWFRTDNEIRWFAPSNLDAIVTAAGQFLD